MLGKFVKIRVKVPMNRRDGNQVLYRLNFGKVESGLKPHAPVLGAYIMGIGHPVHNFDGRVIAVVRTKSEKGVYLVVAPKGKRYIANDIREALAFIYPKGSYCLDCLYERSCGAVVFRRLGGERRYLLIKNKRSAHWGFPKGHIEDGESDEDTAKREVFEEAGLHIRIIPGFKSRSEYSIQGRIEKEVLIFLASTNDTNTHIQPEEIEDYIWLSYENALKTLNYQNDKVIFEKAKAFLEENNL